MKNDLTLNEGKGVDALIDEIAIAKLVVNRFFHGHSNVGRDPLHEVLLCSPIHCVSHIAQS